MKYKIDTHAHTIVSGHAYSSIREMAREASRLGMEAISLTEHAPAMAGTTGTYYFQNSKVIPPSMEGVKILCGTELNILNQQGEVDLSEEICRQLDIVIASMHVPEECYGESKGIASNTDAYVNTMKKSYIHIIGHPDDARLPVDYDTLVSAAKEYGKIIEVNNSSLTPNSFRKGARENQLAYLELCKKYKVPISLGSDAHVDIDIGNFQYAQIVLEECKFPKELIVNRSFECLQSYIQSRKFL